MEIGSIGDWVSVLIALITLILYILIERTRLKNVPPGITRWFRLGFFGLVVGIFLGGIFWGGYQLGLRTSTNLNAESPLTEIVVTQVVEVTRVVEVTDEPLPTPSAAPPNLAFKIEGAPFNGYPYEGQTDASTGIGNVYVSFMNSWINNELSTGYVVEYDLPESGEAWAGISLKFIDPIDISAFDTIQFTIEFSDDQTKGALFLKDSFGEDDYVILGDGEVVTPSRLPQTVQLDLSTFFPSIARSSVREIVFDANTSFTSGNHNFSVRDIQFINR